MKSLTAIFISVLLFGNASSQECLTKPKNEEARMTHAQMTEIISRRSLPGFKTIRIMVHLLKNDVCGLGPTWDEVHEELEEVQSRFASQDICFALIGINNICEADYIFDDWDEETTIPELNALFGNSNRLDIFVVPDVVGFAGNAFDIPNNFLGVGEQRFGLNTLSHEIGHCLGLYHTHHQYDKFNDGEITDICDPLLERVDGSNCSTAGDMCCDTPADPVLESNVNDDCEYVGSSLDCNNDPFDPSIENIMAYSLGCREYFTPDQRNFMHAELEAGSIGPPFLIPGIVTLPPLIISSGDAYRIWASQHITHTADDVYVIIGTGRVTHIPSDHITLRPGFWAKPLESGFYYGTINPLCN